MNLFTKQKQTLCLSVHKHRKPIYGYRSGEDMGRDKLRLWDQQTKTTIHEIDNKVLLYSTRNCIQYSVTDHNRKEFEKDCISIYLNHFALCHKPTHYKSTIFNNSNKETTEHTKAQRNSYVKNVSILNFCHLKRRSLEQQWCLHLEAYQKCRISGPIQTCRVRIYILIKSPGDSHAH